MTLTDRGAGRDRDHHVGEVTPGRLADPEPAQLHRRLELGDRPARRLGGPGRSPIHEHVNVPAHQPARRDQHERGDEKRGGGVRVRITGTREQKAAEDSGRAQQVAAEVERVRLERGAPVTARRTRRDDHPEEVDDDHEPEHRDRVPGRVHGRLRCAEQVVESAPRDRETEDHEDATLGQGREVLRLAVTVRMPPVGRTARDPDREEGQERCDEIGPRMGRLRDQPQAAGGDTRAELECDQGGGREHGDQHGASLRTHRARLDPPERRGSTVMRGRRAQTQTPLTRLRGVPDTPPRCP